VQITMNKDNSIAEDEDTERRTSQFITVSQDDQQATQIEKGKQVEDTKGEIDGKAYAAIVNKSSNPLFAFLNVAFKEDFRMLLPRVLMRTLRTTRRIPRTFVIKTEQELERYVFQTILMWAHSLVKITKMQLEIRDAKKVATDQTYLFAANHRSPADVPVLYDAIPQHAAFVANTLFERVPVLSYWMRASGSVFVDLNDLKSEMRALKVMEKRLKQGRSLIVFPEGHMHQGNGLDEFNRGGLYVAVLCGVPILPIATYGTDKVIRPGSFHINPYRHVVVQFGDPIDTQHLSRTEKKTIHFIVRDVILQMRTALEKEFSPLK